LRKYENIIKQQLLDYTLYAHQVYRPEYASYDIYGTTDLWYLLLFVNNMTRPDEFNKTKIKVFNPAYMDLLNNIIEKEKASLLSKDTPIIVDRNILKDLNQPSKRILSSLYDTQIKPLPIPTRTVNLNTIADFSTGFVQDYISIYRNKLLKRDYLIADDVGASVSLTGSSLINDFKLDYDNTEGFPADWKNKFRQEFEGLIYIDNSGEYEIKPVMIGSAKVWLNDEEILSASSTNFTVTENLFESSSGNSDFKLGTTDGWNVIDGELVDDNGTPALHKSYVDTDNGSNIASVNLDLAYVHSYKEMVLTTRYKSINNNNVLFAGATAEVTYTNGLVETFANNPSYDYFNNNGNYIDAMLLLTLHKNLTLQSIVVNFPVDKVPYYNEKLNGEIFISSLKVQQLLYVTKKVDLDDGKWYKIKVDYDMINQPASYFKMLWMKPSEDKFSRIPDNIFACIPDATVNSTEQTHCAINNFYNYDETNFFTSNIGESNDFNLSDLNPDPRYVPLNTNYTLRQESSFTITANRKYKIEANIDDEVKVYKDSILWFNKPSGTAEVEETLNDSPVNTKVNLEVVYKHISGNENAYYRMKMYPDEYNNPVWATFSSKASSKVGGLTAPWSSNSNNVNMNTYAQGIAKYYYHENVNLDDYRIKLLLNTDDIIHPGNIGIMFRIQGEDEYYLYTLKRDNLSVGTQKSLISGLYKISPLYSEMDLVSDGMYKIKAKLLATTEQKYVADESNYVYIVLTQDTIRIYNQINQRPMIEYTDTDAPLMTGGFGFFVFNQDSVNFSDIEVSY